MTSYPVHVVFPGRLVFVGFGSIGQGVLPLILRHVGIKPDQITIVTADDSGAQVAQEYGVRFVKHALTRGNYKTVLDPIVGRGDFLLNLSVDVSSIALVKLCWEKGALYLDTCIEPWPGGYTDPTIAPARRTNYALREEALALRDTKQRAPTAVLTHGANPGLVSHLVKQALLNIAADTGVAGRRAGLAGRMGATCAEARRQGHPHRRARHAGVQPAEGAERIRQHLVRGRLRRRGLPASRARLGLAREELAARRQATRVSSRQRHLPDAAGRRDARAHVDAAVRVRSTAS